MTTTTISVRAPLKGRIVPLGDVPDPMFALGMMGDGVAIEPEIGEVRAPVDGTVTSVHRRAHAVKVQTDDGAELLVHVGLEAVALRGTGLTAVVAEGDRVAAGDLLIRFDLALLAETCGIVTTPVLVTNEEAFHVTGRRADGEVDFGDQVMTVLPIGVETPPPVERAERTVVLEMTEGLHARPAALLAARAKQYASAVEVLLGERKANAKSPVSLLTLGSRWGSRLTVAAEGADAVAAVDGVVEAIASGLGDPLVPFVDAGQETLPGVDTATTVEEPPVDLTPFGPADRPLLKGVVAAPGLAIGRAVHLKEKVARPAEQGGDVETESAALDAALARVHAHLSEQAAGGRTPQQREIMAAHAALLEDTELLEGARDRIAAGKSAGWAFSDTISAQAALLRGLDNARLAERAADLVDLEQQVLTVLAGGSPESLALPEDAVAIADDLLPSQFMAFGDRLPAAFVVAKGGRTSHVAILSAASGVPMLAAVGPDARRIPEGTPLIVDAERGEIQVNPEPATVEATRRAAAERETRRAANREAAPVDCVMADGTRLPVYANVGSVADAARGLAFGAEGSGLLRTEFLFLDRPTAPTEAEQQAEYQAIADALRGKPLTIRTLDIGGDKPLPYLKQPAEENPILGVRGIRVSKRRPDLLRQQFRAILKVTPVSVVRIMLPMIADVGELRWAKAIFEEEKAALGVTADVPLGIMIEVPAAVAMADKLAKEAAFFSVGTNDLTQYVLAMDRGNTELAPEIDSLHPAVLRTIGDAAAAGQRHGCPVGVCGGLASELPAAPILIGLGVTSLSATRSGIPDLKAFIRTLDRETCRAVAEEALALDSAAEVRAMVARRWPDL
ncbi:phosphoenolpyruvate--protein phosphotransferase [Pleomorphomonas koreensis]|uniref:phosphoenolpyruvate--protein phosphotransferase n=1 Tax=Pleomorphomonas koreensis TaxID=257440 RepID=UPI00041250E4|nr:phosphoenolpyruvate--protein phosphotransferase [Pleomorphomonas koreensis]